MRYSTAWQKAEQKIRQRAANSALAWLPSCGEADIRRMLAVLLGEWAECGLADYGADRIARMIPRVERLLATERGRARSGSRAYDLNRHIACCQLLKALQSRLRASENAAG